MHPNNTESSLSKDPTDYIYELPGVILVGALLHSFLLGFVLAQGLKYWEEYPEDSLRKRVFVLSVVLLSTVQTVLEAYKTYTVSIYDHFWNKNPFFAPDFFVNGAISAMCEAFYIHRCWKLTGKTPWVLYPLALLWTTVCSAQLFITITTGIEYRLYQNYLAAHILTSIEEDQRFETDLHNTIIVFRYWVAGCTILDVSVAAILIICLVRSKTGLNASDSAINRIILLALETAFLPSICMIIAMGLTHGKISDGKHDDLIIFFIFLTAKIYAIGLLRTLNARAKLRQRIGSTDLGRTTLSNWSWAQDEPHEEATKPDRTSKETDPILPASVQPSAPTCHSYEGVAAQESVDLPRVHFGSPLLDQFEQGYARRRVSSMSSRPKHRLDSLEESDSTL